MINLWSSMKVSHLHLYTQLLPSSEWQLCFTRRYSSTVWRTFCVEWQVEVICEIFKIDGEQNFLSYFGYPNEYSDWALGIEFWFSARVELVLFCAAFRFSWGSLSLLFVVCKGMGIKQLWCEYSHSIPPLPYH
jgi:hypothetical protein